MIKTVLKKIYVCKYMDVAFGCDGPDQNDVIELDGVP